MPHRVGSEFVRQPCGKGGRQTVKSQCKRQDTRSGISLNGMANARDVQKIRICVLVRVGNHACARGAQVKDQEGGAPRNAAGQHKAPGWIGSDSPGSCTCIRKGDWSPGCPGTRKCVAVRQDRAQATRAAPRALQHIPSCRPYTSASSHPQSPFVLYVFDASRHRSLASPLQGEGCCVGFVRNVAACSGCVRVVSGSEKSAAGRPRPGRRKLCMSPMLSTSCTSPMDQKRR